MTVDDLIQKYLLGEKLNRSEILFLKTNLSRQRLEHLATRREAYGSLSGALCKLSRILYSTQAKRSAVPVRTATTAARESQNTYIRRIVSGGGANSTSKKR